MNTSNLKRGLVIALALILGSAGMISLKFSRPGEVLAHHTGANSNAPLPVPQSSDLVNGHPVYAHSIVKGGVHSAEELLDVMRNDPDVAAHYKDFDVAKAHIVTLDHAFLAFVSYRLEGKGIFWTMHQVLIPANEPLLTDGNSYIRVRCGNMISSNGMTPVNKPNEPSDLDTIVTPLIPPVHESGPSDESSEDYTESPAYIVPSTSTLIGPPPGSPAPVLPPTAPGQPIGVPGNCYGCGVPIIGLPSPPSNPIIPDVPLSPTTPPTGVPEPDSLCLLALGIAALPLLKIWKKRIARSPRLSN
jgi:hypothetical protein